MFYSHVEKSKKRDRRGSERQLINSQKVGKCKMNKVSKWILLSKKVQENIKILIHWPHCELFDLLEFLLGCLEKFCNLYKVFLWNLTSKQYNVHLTRFSCSKNVKMALSQKCFHFGSNLKKNVPNHYPNALSM